ncbi:MAG: VCBS repeat-containing protein [Sphingobacteriales bacterium]|nr:VCBS repeat-containing protein [Sphingobacteriales bacterium]MBI3719606.1 VCBS repeat-containing protein [Sphingobacteriales bacterium]
MKVLTLLLSVFCFVSCKNSHTTFRLISSDQSGIDFANTIIENDSVNPIDLTNIYNGGGVGIADFNNDGLMDIYFAGNQVANKLYLNKGNLKFEDVTSTANVDGEHKWCRGVSVVDINNDGLQDLYISATILNNPQLRENILYINQGNDKQGIPHFKNMAAEYGLNDTTHTTMADFFDYDNDGDLDVYLVVNQISSGNNPSQFRKIITDGTYPSTGRLYRNDWNDSLHHPYFTDVTKQAGVTIEGYGHAATIADFNMDGWKDIYVSNDFISSDLLYINNHDGTFTNKATSYFRHTSANGMGQDVIDINNDGLSDVIELDMNPEDNYRKKTMMSSGMYLTYQNSDRFGYQYQYVRNTLQLNQGSSVGADDSVSNPVFSDVSFYSGVAETDWSWTPLVADFDNDSYRDIIITNGFPRDITDHDFIEFRKQSSTIASKEFVLEQIPIVKLHNYAFKNNGDMKFENVTDSWGLSTPSFSNGAAYADLDNDGDLDIVINNINDKAFVYENTINSANKISSNYLKIKFNGDKNNINGIGAWAELYYNNGEKQAYENTPYRGYLSSIYPLAYFGLGKVLEVDSVIIRWPGNKKQVLHKVKANQVLSVDFKNALLQDSWNSDPLLKNNLFTDVTNDYGINYVHKERDYIDFDRERLIPHKLSQYGPGLAAGDMNGDGLDDICIGGSTNSAAKILLQQKDGKFSTTNLMQIDTNGFNTEDMGLLLFDADNDGDLDLYAASGSDEYLANTNKYQDRLFVNNGNGKFLPDTLALPVNYTSKSCVKACDFDNDGDLDLFIGGRCLPGKYPSAVSSFIYRNDSKDGKIKFTDITATAAKDLQNIGMVCDAIWTDFDNDGATDLIVVGEWMPVTFFKNVNGKFENISAQTGINNQTGWWNSIAGGDFDNDGDIDYIVGNLGENSFFRTSEQYPVKLYAKDFDNNNSLDVIMTVFLKDKNQNGVLKEFTAMNRNDIIGQLPVLRKKFLQYKAFADADINQIFTEAERKGATVLQANNFKSCYLQNDGHGKFSLHALPALAQIAPLNGFVVDDFNGDGNLDVAACGNDYGNEVTNGRYDALDGLILLGDGTGNFKTQKIAESGFFVPFDAKALVKLKGANNNYLLAASQNRGPLKLFSSRSNGKKLIPLKQTDKSIILSLTNGKKRKEEIYFGNSFLSQSSLFLTADKNILSVEVKDRNGKIRLINLQ